MAKILPLFGSNPWIIIEDGCVQSNDYKTGFQVRRTGKVKELQRESTEKCQDPWMQIYMRTPLYSMHFINCIEKS